MLELDGVAAGTEKVPLVIHLPGFTGRPCGQTPLLELVAVGTEYRKALATLVTEAAAGQVRPDQIEAFKGQPGLTLAGADAWLSRAPRRRDGGPRRTAPGHEPGRPSSTTCSPAGHRPADRRPEDRGRALGAVRRVDRPHRGLAGGHAPRRAARVPRTWRSRRRAGRCALEYADDLNAARRSAATWRPPPPCRARSSTPAAPSRRTCGSATRASTSGRPTRRRRCSPMRSSGPGPRTSAPIGTFRFAEGKVLRAALAALGDAAYDQAAAWAGPRRGPRADGCVVLAPRRSRAAVRLAARPRRGPPRAGDRPGGCTDRRGPGRRRRRWRRPSPPIPSAAPPSTRRTGTWSRRGWPCSTRCSRSSRRCGRASTGCGSPGGRGPMAGRGSSTRSARRAGSCQAPRSSSGRSSMRWSEPLVAEPGDDRVLRGRRPPVRDGRGAVPADGGHPGDHRDAAGPGSPSSPP